MSDKTTPPTSKENPKRLSLNDLIPQRIELQTKEGSIYARHLATLDYRALAPLVDDAAVRDETLGREAVRRLLSRSKSAFDEPLVEGELGTIAPIHEMVSAVAKMVGGPLRGSGSEALAEIGANIRQRVHDHRDTSRRIAESLKFVGPDVQSRLGLQLDAIGAASRNLSSIAAIDAPRLNVSPIEARPPALHDFGPSPLIRASELTVEKLNSIATQLAALASSEAELLRTITLDVVPRWEEASRAADATSKRALSLSRWSIGIALVALLASALVPYHILKLQDDAAAADRKVDMADRARQESLMREQLDAMRSMRTQLEQQARAGRR